MKPLFLILSLTLSLTTFAQRLTPPIRHAQDSVINKHDSLGRKTGLWVKYYYTNTGDRIIENTGYYQKGRKIGVWKYYNNGSDYISCLDTSQCIALTETYEADGSVTILGMDKTVINADSSLIVFTRKNHSEVTCKKNKQGEYECTRIYNSTSTKPTHKTFIDFENCLHNIDTKW